VRIIFDFRFAIFDRGRDPRILTQRRKGAKTPRVLGRGGFGCQYEPGHQKTGDTFRLCALASLRPCVRPVKVVKVVERKKHPCKSLIMNGVKPSQGKSNQFSRGVKVVAKAAKIAGLETDQSWQQVNLAGGLGDNIWQGVSDKVSYSQINSPIVTYGHIVRRSFFSSAGKKLETADQGRGLVPDLPHMAAPYSDKLKLELRTWRGLH
jgi:hypothetical protein